MLQKAMQTLTRSGSARPMLPSVAMFAAMFSALFAVNIAAAPAAQAAGAVEVRVSALNNGNLDVRYTLPPGCNVLPLRDGPWPLRVARQLRSEWLAMDDCGGLGEQGVVRSKASCSTVRFSVPARATIIDRVSPPVYPVGDEGLYVHTGSFAPSSTCGPVNWRFAAPGGMVVFDGAARGAEFSMPESSAPTLRFTAVYLSYRGLALSADPVTVFEPAVPGWLRSGLEEASAGIIPHYRKTFPQLPVPSPAVIATNVKADGPMRFQADVSDGRMMRFSFYNYGPELDVRRLAEARGTVAHEYAHVLQAGMRSEAFLHPERTLLNEGGAEFIRWISEYRLGWKTGAALGQELNDAVNLCLMEVGDLPWKRVMNRNSGMTPYRCGLAVHVLALAARRSPERAETVLGNYYAVVRRNPDANFAQAIECGSTPNCEAQILPDLFKSNAGFASQLGALMMRLGVVLKNDVRPTPATQSLAAVASFAQLMREDCSAVGFRTMPDHFLVERTSTCHTLENGMQVFKAGGIDMFAEPHQAAMAVMESCEKTGTVLIGLRDQRDIEVACRNPYRPVRNFYALDIAKIFTLLDGR